MSGDWTAKDQCTWLIKSTCGAPGIKIENEGTTSSDVEIFYMEYNPNEGVDLHVDTNGATTNWPKYT